MRPISYIIGYQGETNILTQLRFIHNWVLTGIQWMVCWWVLIHCGPCSFDVEYRPAPGINTNSKNPNSLWYGAEEAIPGPYEFHTILKIRNIYIYVPVSYKQKLNLGPNTKTRLRLKSQKIPNTCTSLVWKRKTLILLCSIVDARRPRLISVFNNWNTDE
jgi:hypothetical protein